jgi:trans-aconitate methyltransferase
VETIRGRLSHEINLIELSERLAHYKNITLDIGTGDGRFVRSMAEKHRDNFFIGIDACRENLRANSRKKLSNAMFVIASAQALPLELNGLASYVSINFPWGSLLESLLRNDPSLTNRLLSITRLGAELDIHLNGDALATAGSTLESGADQIEHVLNDVGWKTKSRSCLDAHTLRSFSTTWAKRLAFGRDPRAVRLSLRRE